MPNLETVWENMQVKSNSV